MEALHHLVAVQQLAVEVRDEAGRQLSLRVVALQGQAHRHLHDTVLVGADVEIVQEVLRATQTHVKGVCKVKKIQKNEITRWKWVVALGTGFTLIFFLNRPKIVLYQ